MAQPDDAALRLYVGDGLHGGAMLTASLGQAHYLQHVMRRRVGAAVVVFNGRDGVFAGTIAVLERGRAVLAVGARMASQVAETPLWLAFGLLKRGATELIVQKATELGATDIAPVLTARTNAGSVNPDRLRAIAIEAAEQSERMSVPSLHAPQSLAALLAGWPAGRRLVVCVERDAAPPVVRAEGPAGMLVGPEGGFTRVELDALRACPFVEPASLGPRILRAETAAIAGLALLGAA